MSNLYNKKKTELENIGIFMFDLDFAKERKECAWVWLVAYQQKIQSY